MYKSICRSITFSTCLINAEVRKARRLKDIALLIVNSVLILLHNIILYYYNFLLISNYCGLIILEKD